MKLTFRVTIEITGVHVDEVKEYVRTAIKQWGKGGRPDSPFFHLDEPMVTVVRATAKDMSIAP